MSTIKGAGNVPAQLKADLEAASGAEFARRLWQAHTRAESLKGGPIYQREAAAFLATALHLGSFTTSAITAYFKGNRPGSVDSMIALAHFYGVRPAWLIHGEAPMVAGAAEDVNRPGAGLTGSVVPPAAFVPTAARQGTSAHEQQMRGNSRHL